MSFSKRSKHAQVRCSVTFRTHESSVEKDIALTWFAGMPEVDFSKLLLGPDDARVLALRDDLARNHKKEMSQGVSCLSTPALQL